MNKFFSVLFLAVLTAGYAQAQFTFGARAGLNLTNISSRYDGKKITGDEKSKFKPGFQIGVVGEYAISDNLVLQPGILLSQQGYRFKFSMDEPGYKLESKATCNINYLQIPVHAQYKLDMGAMNLLLQAGPYFGFAIGGKAKWEDTEDGVTEKGDEKLKFGNDPEEHFCKALDFGLGIGAGLQFDNIQVGLGYQLGLANLSNYDKNKLNNYGLALTVTYFFGN